MTILDTPKDLSEKDVMGYLRHCIEEIERGKVGLFNIDWTVSPNMNQEVRVNINIGLVQIITGSERRRVSDNKPWPP